MPALVLYSFRRCPYAMRARMAIKISGIRCELREVVLKDKPEQMLLASPKGTVPVLVTAHQVVDESIDVMRWAIRANDPDHWNADELEHGLLQRNDEYFKTYLDRYKYFDRYPGAPQQAYLQKALCFIDELEAAMQCSGARGYYLLNPKLSAIDVAIFPFVRQFAFVDKARFDSLEYPKVQAWLNQLLAADIFLSIMTKHRQWAPEQTDVVYI